MKDYIFNNYILWRPYDDGKYIVSTHGKVYSTKSKKILKPFISCGYEQVYIYKNKKRKHKSIHRLVAELFIPNKLNKPVVNHIDSNKRNNNVSNLEWMTYKENANHANKNNLIKRRTGPGQQKNYDVDFKDAKIIINHPQYFIFKDGRVYSTKSNIFMKIYKQINNYIYINIQNKNYLIHRLIAIHFIPNPNKYTIVNHKNGNKEDNNIENLEWVSSKQNTIHAVESKLIDYSKNYKVVIKYNINQEELERYKSVKEAMKKNDRCSSISQCCSGKLRTAGGYLWRYENNKYENVLFKGAKQLYNTMYLLLEDRRLYSTTLKRFMHLYNKGHKSKREYYLIQMNKKRSKLYVDNL